MLKAPRITAAEESYEIVYKCLMVGSMSVKAGMSAENYLGQEGMPEGRPAVVVTRSGISFRIRLLKYNRQCHVKIPREEIESIRIYNQENPGFMLMEVSSSMAEQICILLHMKKSFGPYLDPCAIEMKQKFIVVHCDSRIIPTNGEPFITYMKFYHRLSPYRSFFQILKTSEVQQYIPTTSGEAEAVDDSHENLPLQLADQVKIYRRLKKLGIDEKGDRLKNYEELIASDALENRSPGRKNTNPTSSDSESSEHKSNGTNGHHLGTDTITIHDSDSDSKMEVDEVVTEPHEGKESDLANIMNFGPMDDRPIADDESTLTAPSPSRDSLEEELEQADKGGTSQPPKSETISFPPADVAPVSSSSDTDKPPSVSDRKSKKQRSRVSSDIQLRSHTKKATTMSKLKLTRIQDPKVTKEKEEDFLTDDDIKLQLDLKRKKVTEGLRFKKASATKQTDAATVASTSTEKNAAEQPSVAKEDEPSLPKASEEENTVARPSEVKEENAADQPSTSQPKRVKEPIIRKARKTNGKRPIAKYLMLPDERAKITSDDSQEMVEHTQRIRSDMMDVMKITPLCQCNMTVYKPITFDKVAVCCMALEMVYGRIMGCANPVKTGRLYRSQSNKATVVLCEEHKERMFRHENCPGCGMFCVGGKCIVCVKCSDVPHRFHRECASAQCNVETCLHCGATSDYHRDVELVPGRDLEIEYLANGQDPEKLIKKHYLQQRIRTARIRGENHFPLDVELGDLGEDEEKKCRRILPEGIVFNALELPPGPDRSQMLRIIKNMVPGKKTQQFNPPKFINYVKDSNIEEFMNVMINLNSRQNYFSTFNRALFVAYDVRVKPIIYVLFLYGCDPDVKNMAGQTLLYKAVEESNYEYIYWLLLRGANPTKRDDRCGEGMTPFHLAALRGDIRAVYLILQSHKIDINMKDNDDWTPFCLAAKEGNVKMAEYLLCMGADPSIFSNSGYNGLHWAVKSKSVDLVRLCLQKGMDIDKRCIKGGNTPLHLAALNSDYATVTLLLSRGANPNAKNNQSKDPSNNAELKPAANIWDALRHSEKSAFNSMTWLALRVNSMGRELFKKPVIPPPFERLLCEDMSRGHAAVPVSCVNSVDSAGCPTCEVSEKQFRYVTDFIVVDKNSQPNMMLTPLDTCDCKDTCGSNRSCTCCRYGCYYDDNGHLLPHLNPSNMEPIYECTRMCACSKTCRNRVVQYGTRFRLQVYRTEYMGWGLRSLDAIPKGAFVIDYVGEIVSDELADQREEDTYLFDLLDNKMDAVYCVDANKYGNCSRFINHLCDANLYTIRTYTEHRNTPFPRLAFFSIKSIAPYEELGFDYGESFWNVKSKMNIFCQCYSPNCKYSAEHYARKRKEEEAKQNCD